MPDKWAKSRRMLEEAREALAGGVSSPFRAQFPVPLYFEDGCGARLRDVDGNTYIDYTLAWGPAILGHKHPRVVEAMKSAAERPHIYGAQHALELAVAPKIRKMVPCAERLVFTSSGSEAVQLALRLARGFTRRQKVLKFEGHYHGWMDSVLWQYRNLGEPGSKGQTLNSRDNLLFAEWNDRLGVEGVFAERGGEIAAVIAEPVLCNSGCLMPEPGFLELLRRLTEAAGALLIFDEVITGFRMAPGGAQAAFGVTPDLATFGKAVGGGLPLSLVAGRKEILDLMQGGGVVFGGTFNGNPMSLAAASAALDELADPTALERANHTGKQLMNGIAAAAASNGVPVRVTGFGAAFGVHFTETMRLSSYRDTLGNNRERQTAYVRGMLEEGIYLLPDGRVYVSLVHAEAEVAETLAAAERVLATLA
ncbi:MAG: aspartate aminotransferase family protein [Acidimicrobiia bacterium]|nr:aspartate aminotransferase family protein [Acidimicrobiia bacterium]